MSLSDCEKCWETPCICGWDYRNMNKEKRIDLASTILDVDPKVIRVCLGNLVPKEHKLKNESK